MSEAEHATYAVTTTTPEAVATLRKIKESESTWQRKLEEARQRGESRLKEAQAGRERLLADARREAEKLRTLRVQEARGQADTQKILAAAQAQAAQMGLLSPQEIDRRTEEILSAVLGELRGNGAKVTLAASR